MNNTTRWITINAMGVAMFVVLSMCLRVPIYDNFYVCLGYVVMTAYLYLFDPLSGTIVGVLGTVIYSLLIDGLRGMPGWCLANIVIGVNVGLVLQMVRHRVFENKLVKYLSITLVTILTVGLGIFVGKAGFESIIYAQPWLVRIVTNTPAFISDTLVIVLSVPFCELLARNKCISRYIEKVSLR